MECKDILNLIAIVVISIAAVLIGQHLQNRAEIRKDKAVRAAWKELYEAYSSTEQSDLMANKRKNLMYKLLEEIAKNIGYKKEITWETIQNPYIPQGMVDKWQEQAASQQAYNTLLNSMANIIPKERKNTEEQNEH